MTSYDDRSGFPPAGQMGPGIPPVGQMGPGIPPAGQIGPGIPPSGMMGPGIPPAGQMGPGIPPSGQMGPGFPPAGQMGQPTPYPVTLMQPASGGYAPAYGVPTNPLSSASQRYLATPVLVKCRFCEATVTTTLNYKVGLVTWAVAGMVFLMGGSLGCCLIPCCLDSCKDVIHSCPNCNKDLGHYNRF